MFVSVCDTTTRNRGKGLTTDSEVDLLLSGNQLN